MLKEDILNPRKDTLYELFSLIEYLCLGMCQKSQIFSRRDIGVLFVHDICSVCQFYDRHSNCLRRLVMERNT